MLLPYTFESPISDSHQGNLTLLPETGRRMGLCIHSIVYSRLHPVCQAFTSPRSRYHTTALAVKSVGTSKLLHYKVAETEGSLEDTSCKNENGEVVLQRNLRGLASPSRRRVPKSCAASHRGFPLFFFWKSRMPLCCLLCMVLRNMSVWPACCSRLCRPAASSPILLRVAFLYFRPNTRAEEYLARTSPRSHPGRGFSLWSASARSQTCEDPPSLHTSRQQTPHKRPSSVWSKLLRQQNLFERIQTHFTKAGPVYAS